MSADSRPIAIITGAGRGIGRAAALELAAAGFDLGLVARTVTDLADVAEQAAQRGAEALALPGSVTSEDEVGAIFNTVRARWGKLDALVNCAGEAFFGPLEETTPATWERVVGTNLTGAYLCCRAALPLFPAEGGKIINVISIAGKVAFPNAAAYCASKWGALGFSKALAEEVRGQGIRVTAFCPGSTDTPLWGRVEHGLDRSKMLRPERVGELIRTLATQPADVSVDEIVVTPPGGIL